MLDAWTRQNENRAQKVVAASAGRRRRMLTVAGLVVAVAAVLYIGAVGASVLQAPEPSS